MTTMTITAADINKLRKATGAGMMDCKKALTETGGDFDKAIDELRKKGQKIAAKRSDRDSNEGIVIAAVSEDKKTGVILSVNCETDFVAINDDFKQFVNKIVGIVIENLPADDAALKALAFDDKLTIAEKLIEQTGVIGEKLELNNYTLINAESVYAYNHPGNNLADIVGFNNAEVSDEVSKDVAMQIAAMAPVALDKDGVDDETVKREIAVGMEQAREAGKPEEMLEKIAMGKLNKFYKESTLLNQAFIKDNKKTIAKYMDDSLKGLTATQFKRVALS
jgi:elongation factor Ts